MDKKHKSLSIPRKKITLKKKIYSDDDKVNVETVNEQLIKYEIYKKFSTANKEELSKLTPKIIRLFLEEKYGKNKIKLFSKKIKEWSREIFKQFRKNKKKKKILDQ